MTEGPTGSTVPRRQLGRYLRDLRNQARLTVRAAAKALEWSEAKMWRIESGQTSLRSHDAETMCRVYGASDELTAALMGLAKETKARGWWHSYGDVIPEGFDVYIGLEEAADQLSWYESELMPGLLQTEDYARTIIQAHNPDEDPEEIERRVHLRIARQGSITRVTAPPKLEVVLNEGLLHRPIGGRKVMAAQLGHLLEMSKLETVTIKVVPFEAGMHRGVLTGPFIVLRFPRAGGITSEPPTVYSDGYTGDLYLDKPSEVERYDEAFNDIWDKALTEQASRRLLADMAGSYEDG
ncbi:helix-turn-helix domain-containing protein [Streptomyces sp. NA02950]|uniref:helix-turn-helix domain-containing protein n=1 Tax=Streptomyces sp. NA02950 TaxID=2742137 RepID=UPI001590B480|nr:helix-turn-helix transcriptional regulator [Streptomyces sp. NA02950]QKV94709.1 helix-turn-helix domain-containing protein [Streptomyces sp. NA02950]